VRLTCPACDRAWEASPGELPAPKESFVCPDCAERRPTAEFTRTKRDLETLEQFH